MVTGGGGLIGAHVVRALLAAKCDVHALVRRGGSSRALDGLAVQCFEGDVLTRDAALLSAIRDCDVVIHTAAHFSYAADTTGRLLTLATAGTENVLRAAAEAGVRRVVVTSSSVVFGYRVRPDILVDEYAPLCADEQPPYVTAKVAQHRHSLALGRELGLDVVLGCPTITVGPTATELGPSNGLIAAYLNDAFRCTFPGGCNIVAAQDVARGHVLLAMHGVAGESYLLGSENLTWRAIHRQIAELVGLPAPAIELNHTTAFLAATAEEVWASFEHRAPRSTRAQAAMIGRYYWYTHAKAARIGYAPSSARDALTGAISWLVTSSHLSREIRARLRLSDEIYRFRRSHRAFNPASQVQ
jgi:dihydroflavonol-4-reductase